MTSTVVCFVEVLATKDWPKEDINKNLPGYLIFFAIGMSNLSRNSGTHDNPEISGCHVGGHVLALKNCLDRENESELTGYRFG